MRSGLIRGVGSLVFLLFLLDPAALAFDYVRPTPEPGLGPPTKADLRFYSGRQKTLAVQLLNLTPYPIELKSTSISDQDALDMQNRDRETNKSFMFAPVGIPKSIPAASPSSHPYSMAFSWVDDPEFVTDNWVRWTVKDVKYCATDWDERNHRCDGAYAKRDVDLGLWMYRLEPPPTAVESGYLPLLSKFLLTVMKTGLLALEPMNPVAWVDEFLAISEFSMTIKEFDDSGTTDEQNAKFAAENSEVDEGTEMFVASYVIPNPTSLCARNPGCSPSTIEEQAESNATDAVHAMWPAADAGPCEGTYCATIAAEANLTVTAELLRGQAAPECPEDAPEWSDHLCGIGRVPTLMVTVMTTDEFVAAQLATGSQAQQTLGSSAAGATLEKMRLFLLQAGAGRIRAILLREGQPGLVELRSIVEGLSPAQRDVLRRMVATMATRQHPDAAEREVVRYIGNALQLRFK